MQSVHLHRNFIFAVLLTVAAGIISRWGFALSLAYWHYLVIFLLVYPWQIKGNVISLFGGSSRKGVYSLVGVYQHAGTTACQLLGLSLYQRAGEDAYHFFGVSLQQYAGRSAIHWIGISLFQRAGGNALQVASLSVVQSAGYEANCAVGVCLYQYGKMDVGQIIALSLYQQSYCKSAAQGFGFVFCQRGQKVGQLFGIAGCQFGVDETEQTFGFVLYQSAKKVNEQKFGIALHQSSAS